MLGGQAQVSPEDALGILVSGQLLKAPWAIMSGCLCASLQQDASQCGMENEGD